MICTQNDIARFWALVAKREDDECWLWKGRRNASGHGRFRLAGKIHYAHRIALSIDGQDITGGLACHTCDNPPCVNPAHLYLGTHKTNADDCSSRGRRRPAYGDSNGARTKPESRARGDAHHSRAYPETVRRGERHPLAKLTDDQRAVAIQSTETATALSKRFRVSRTAICNVRARAKKTDS